MAPMHWLRGQVDRGAVLFEQYPVEQLAASPDHSASNSAHASQNDLLKQSLVEVTVQQ